MLKYKGKFSYFHISKSKSKCKEIINIFIYLIKSLNREKVAYFHSLK